MNDSSAMNKAKEKSYSLVFPQIFRKRRAPVVPRRSLSSSIGKAKDPKGKSARSLRQMETLPPPIRWLIESTQLQNTVRSLKTVNIVLALISRRTINIDGCLWRLFLWSIS